MQEFKDGMCVSSPEEFIEILKNPKNIALLQAAGKSFFIFLKTKDISDITEMVEIRISNDVHNSQLRLMIYEDNPRSQADTVRKIAGWAVDNFVHPEVKFFSMTLNAVARKLFEQKKEAYKESVHADTLSVSSPSPDFSSLPVMQAQQLQRHYPSKAKIFLSISAASLLAGAGVAALYAYKTGLFAASAFTLSMLVPPVAVMLGAALLVWTVLSLVALCCLFPRNQRSDHAGFFGSSDRYAGVNNDLSSRELQTYTK